MPLNPRTPASELEVLVDLPDDILISIGLLVARHSYLEALLVKICYRLAGVDDITGRLAIREPRAHDRLLLIRDLAEHRGCTVRHDLMDLLVRDLSKVTKARDSVAHGIFFKHPETGDILIRNVKGHWQPPGLKKGKMSKRVNPSADPITAEGIDSFSLVADAINEALLLILSDVESQLQRS